MPDSRENNLKRHPFVGIGGNIGVGKTTFTGVVAERLHWRAYYESVQDNPYLSDFYADMRRWSFHLQIYFLHHRFRTHQEMMVDDSGVVQDRTIYEDVEIFARNLYELGHLDQRDWDNYRNLFGIMTTYLRKPDLIVYLRASTDTLVSRIRSRARDYEKNISPEYLHQLNVSYDKWIRSIRDIQVLTVETDHFNIFNDREQLDSILARIAACEVRID